MPILQERQCLRALLTAAASLSAESLLTYSTLSTTVPPNIDGDHSVTFTSTRGNARLGRRQSECW